MLNQQLSFTSLLHTGKGADKDLVVYFEDRKDGAQYFIKVLATESQFLIIIQKPKINESVEKVTVSQSEMPTFFSVSNT